MPRIVSILPASLTTITSNTPSVGEAEGALHAAAEELAIRDHDLLCLRELVRRAVDDHRHRLVLIGQQRESAAHLVRHRTQSFAASVHPVDDVATQTRIGDVDEVAHGRAAVLVLICDATGVKPPNHPAAQDLDRFLGIDRYPQSAPKIAACSQRNHRELAAGRDRRPVPEEAVEDFVEGPIASDRDDHRPRFAHSLLRDLGRLERPRREYDLVRQPTRRQPCFDARPLAPRLAPA